MALRSAEITSCPICWLGHLKLSMATTEESEIASGQAASRYEALFRVSSAIGAYRDPKELFHVLASELRQVVQFDFMAVFLYDQNANTLQIPAIEIMQGAGVVIPPDFPVEESITWWVYHHQQPVVVSSGDRRFPRVMELYKQFEIASACFLPLTTVRRRLGSLAFGAIHSETYSQEDIRYLSLVADQVALTVDNALSNEEQQRSEAFLAEGQRLSRTGSWSWKVQGEQVVWSKEHYRLFGFDPNLGKPTLRNFWERVHPQDEPQLKAMLDQAILEKKDFDREFRIVLPDGSVKNVHGVGRAVLNESGEVVEFIGTTIDITDRKQDQWKLQNQKAHFERLFELAPEAVVLHADGKVVRINKEFTELFGYTAEEAIGKNIDELIVPVEYRDELKTLRAEVRRGQRVEAETLRMRKDGSSFHVSFAAAPVVVGGGELGVYSIYRDITERKRAEEALKRSEAYLVEGQRLSHTGSWAREISTGQIFWSQEMFRIFGLDPGEENPTEEVFLEQIHVEDRQMVKELRHQALLMSKYYEYDCRITLANGETRYIHALGHPVVNDANQPVEFVGTVVDVTEQQNSRMALEQAFVEIKTLKDELHNENIALREEIDQTSMFEEIVGKSEILRRLLNEVNTVASSESTVLIYGETGTGKELVARAIHNLSGRAARALVKVNCAAIPTGLLESELFGHEKGAFTGAIAQRIGRFELANQGTVFLDEVGEISLELQPKLLRVLQEKEFERLGGAKTFKTDARLIAATNRDLSAMVKEQKFRSDLFYRLNVFPIRLPALRERQEDIPLLVQHFVQQFARRMHKTIESIPSGTMRQLCEYSWPGNIRELQNVIERAMILSRGPILRVQLADLKEHGMTASRKQSEVPGSLPRQRLKSLVEETDRQQIMSALQEAKGRVGGPHGAAAHLGLKRTTLLTRMKKLGIRRDDMS